MDKSERTLQTANRGYNDADAGWSAGSTKPHAEPGKVFHPMGTLTVKLLGEFAVALDGTPVTSLNTDRLQSLFGYLLVHRRTAVSRQQLAFLFWPDSNEAQARTNLRNLLFTLNRALPNAEEFLSINGTTLQWRTDAPCTLDVDEFEKAASRADSTDSLREAVGVYHGELLPGLYDDWVLTERERLDREYTQTLEKLIDGLQAKKEYREAIKYAQQLARHDTLREDTYRRLMQLYALSGDRSGVRRVYEQCQSVLKRELDVEPSRETKQAYQQALNYEPAASIAEVAPAFKSLVPPPRVAPPAMPPPAPIPWYRERAFLQNASFAISIAVPLVLLVILAFVVQMPLIVALGISVVVFAGLFFLLNWQTRVEIERQDIADDIRRKLYDCRVRIAQVRALSVRIQNGDVKLLVEQICGQAEGLLEKLESTKSTSLATTSRFEYILAETRDILDRYVQMTRDGGVDEPNATLIREIEDELLPLLHKSLGEFAESLDQNEMIKLEASIRVLEDTLKKEGLN